MPLVRAVSFDGVDQARLDELSQSIERGERPDGVAATEMVVLHEPDAGRALVLIFFETEEDYRRGDEVLGAMSAGETPGRRSAVTKYEVAGRSAG
jgi:hypothetical protein